MALNVAVTVRACVIDTVQLPVPVHAPLQPANVELLAAVAVSVTEAPLREIRAAGGAAIDSGGRRGHGAGTAAGLGDGECDPRDSGAKRLRHHGEEPVRHFHEAGSERVNLVIGVRHHVEAGPLIHDIDRRLRGVEARSPARNRIVECHHVGGAGGAARRAHRNDLRGDDPHVRVVSPHLAHEFRERRDLGLSGIQPPHMSLVPRCITMMSGRAAVSQGGSWLPSAMPVIEKPLWPS